MADRRRLIEHPLRHTVEIRFARLAKLEDAAHELIPEVEPETGSRELIVVPAV
jgi:hypothetical protein